MVYGDLPPWAYYRSPAPDNPLSFAWCMLPFILEITALTFPIPRSFVKWVIVPAIFGCYANLLTMGMVSAVGGYAIGTVTGYHALQVLDLLIFSNPKKDFIFYPPPYTGTGAPAHKSLPSNKTGSLSDRDKDAEEQDKQEGDGNPSRRGIKYTNLTSTASRLNWAINLVFSPRLLHFHNSLETHTVPAHARTRAGFLRHYALRAAILYVTIDYMCYYMRLVDPEYFLPTFPQADHDYEALLNPSPSPPMWYPTRPPKDALLATLIWKGSLYTIRQLTQAGAISIILTLFHQFLALFMVSLQPLFPTSPWTHPTSYPPLFSQLSLQDGLPGFWGKTWHATFKRIFTSPSDFLGLGTKNPARFFMAFVLSGLLHSIGSYSQSRRWSGPLVFFILQGVGASFEVMLRKVLKENFNITTNNSALLRMLIRVWLFTWLLWTAYWFTDEYRRGGLWTAEPVPWSIWRYGARRWGFWGWGVRW